MTNCLNSAGHKQHRRGRLGRLRSRQKVLLTKNNVRKKYLGNIGERVGGSTWTDVGCAKFCWRRERTETASGQGGQRTLWGGNSTRLAFMRFPPPTAVCLGFISIAAKAAKGDRLRRAGYVLMTVHCGWSRAPPDLIWAWPDMACAYNASMWSRDHWPFVTRRDSCSLSLAFCMIISKETATIVVQGTVWLTVWWCGSEMKICLWQCFGFTSTQTFIHSRRNITFTNTKYKYSKR